MDSESAYGIAIASIPPEAKYINQSFAVNSVADFNARVAGGIQNPPVVVPAAHILPHTLQQEW